MASSERRGGDLSGIGAAHPEPDRERLSRNKCFDPDYNCIAWAAEDSTRWWWPASPEDSYWPYPDASVSTVAEFERAFLLLGYEPCADASSLTGVTKVALFVGTLGLVTHMARQLPDGTWTSKCGCHKDILHHQLEDVASAYGSPVAFLGRVDNS